MKTVKTYRLLKHPLSVLCILLFFFIGCTKEEESEDFYPTKQLALGERDNGYLSNSILEITHTKGVDQCPQKIGSVDVFCGDFITSCKADSVSISNNGFTLNAYFNNSRSFTKLNTTPENSNTLTIEYKCNATTSYTYIYRLHFFKNGEKIDHQDLEVKVSIK